MTKQSACYAHFHSNKVFRGDHYKKSGQAQKNSHLTANSSSSAALRGGRKTFTVLTFSSDYAILSSKQIGVSNLDNWRPMFVEKFVKHLSAFFMFIERIVLYVAQSPIYSSFEKHNFMSAIKQKRYHLQNTHRYLFLPERKSVLRLMRIIVYAYIHHLV